jgi:hypothetical protein
MKLHEREKLVRAAEIDLRQALLELGKKHDLTSFEYIQVVQRVLGGEILSTCKYGIRIERHGDPETPGGLAKG